MEKVSVSRPSCQGQFLTLHSTPISYDKEAGDAVTPVDI